VEGGQAGGGGKSSFISTTFAPGEQEEDGEEVHGEKHLGRDVPSLYYSEEDGKRPSRTGDARIKGDLFLRDKEERIELEGDVR
jgi:hypothetical protein